MLRTHNNTDANKLVIFSGIALYYGDTYIVIDSIYSDEYEDVCDMVFVVYKFTVHQIVYSKLMLQVTDQPVNYC